MRDSTQRFSALTSILLSIAVATSILVLCGALISQFRSHRAFQKSLEKAVASIGEEDQELRDSLINDLNRMVELHKASSSTDTTAFFYTFFCSVFIAVGAAYVKSVQTKASVVEQKTAAINETIAIAAQTKIDIKKTFEISSELLAIQNIVAIKEWLSCCASTMQHEDEDVARKNLDKYLPRINDSLRYYETFSMQIKSQEDKALLVFLSDEVSNCFDFCRTLDEEKNLNSFSMQYVSLQKRKLEKCRQHITSLRPLMVAIL
jgi:hypothetical protein